MKKTAYITAPLFATAALFIALHGSSISAAGLDDFTADGVKLRGDGTVDDDQPGAGVVDDDVVDGVKRRGDGTIDDAQRPGAAPVQTVGIINNPDGTTTVVRTRTLDATGAAPNRTRVRESTFGADGGLIGQSRTETRTNADGVVVRERSRSMETVDGVVVRTRTDLRRNDAGEIIRNRERTETLDRADNSGSGRATRIERHEKANRLERAERAEKVERIERAERPEKMERVERHERPEKVERPESGGGHSGRG